MKIAIVSEGRKFGNGKDCASVDFNDEVKYEAYLREQGWGACELLMLSYARGLSQNGHEVKTFTQLLSITDEDQKQNPTLINKVKHESELFKKEMEAFQPDFAFVMHTPNNFSLFPQSIKRIIWQSHRECLMHPNKWDKNCIGTHLNTLKSMSEDPRVRIGVLSKDIQEIYEKLWNGITPFTVIQDNPMDVKLFRHIKNGQLRKRKDISVMVAQIGPRKNQAAYENIRNIHFIGPVFHGGFLNFPASRLSIEGRYLGAWSKKQIYDNLCEYGSAILLSTMEADNMSLKEAMSAGLACVGHAATINQNIRGLPWVFDVTGKSNYQIEQIIKEANAYTHAHSDEIRDWAEKNLDTSVKSIQLLKSI